jgi:hypothetical protein
MACYIHERHHAPGQTTAGEEACSHACAYRPVPRTRPAHPAGTRHRCPPGGDADGRLACPRRERCGGPPARGPPGPGRVLAGTGRECPPVPFPSRARSVPHRAAPRALCVLALTAQWCQKETKVTSAEQEGRARLHHHRRHVSSHRPRRPWRLDAGPTSFRASWRRPWLGGSADRAQSVGSPGPTQAPCRHAVSQAIIKPGKAQSSRTR